MCWKISILGNFKDFVSVSDVSALVYSFQYISYKFNPFQQSSLNSHRILKVSYKICKKPTSRTSTSIINCSITLKISENIWITTQYDCENQQHHSMILICRIKHRRIVLHSCLSEKKDFNTFHRFAAVFSILQQISWIVNKSHHLQLEFNEMLYCCKTPTL